jgi:hypothetical protein
MPPVQSRATIKSVPKQHVPPDVKKLNIEVDYDVPPRGDVPNDVHIEFRKVSPFNGDWHTLINVKRFDRIAWPIEFQFDKPEDQGAYDIRVTFTLDGKKLDDGERTGQFFVD